MYVKLRGRPTKFSIKYITYQISKLNKYRWQLIINTFKKNIKSVILKSA